MTSTAHLLPRRLRRCSTGGTSRGLLFLVLLFLSGPLLHTGDLSGQSAGGATSVLASFDFSSEGGVRVELPGELREISGLAVTGDGRIFGHNDEYGRIFEIDVSTGAVRKFFNVGRLAVPGDFEGLAVVGERFFLLSSAGDLVEFREGNNRTSVAYQVYPLGLGRLCEMEGLAFEPARNALLLPCKTPRIGRLEDHLVVFSVPLDSMTPESEPRIFLPLKELDSAGLGKNFQPSSIEVHPESGSLILVAARQEAIVELNPEGSIVATEELKRKRHPQPEGITFLPDGSMVIADEGQGGRGTLTHYSPARESGGEGPP